MRTDKSLPEGLRYEIKETKKRRLEAMKKEFVAEFVKGGSMKIKTTEEGYSLTDFSRRSIVFYQSAQVASTFSPIKEK